MADEVKLDDETGLPAIPEDHYWRVQAKNRKVYELLLMRRPARDKFELEDVCVDSNTVLESVLFTARDGADAAEREIEARGGYEAGWRGPDVYEGQWCITNTRITPGRILLTAERIMKRFNEADRITPMLGNYPPNTLKRDSE